MKELKDLLDTPAGAHWKSLGAKRRAGVALPLFSVFSRRSIGVGEFRDLEIVADWCRGAGMSLIQLLPLNDIGDDFRPYDAQSAIALEPMHLALDQIVSVPRRFGREIAALGRRFPYGSFYFDTAIKAEKLALLWKMFRSRKVRDKQFERFIDQERFWLDDHALFKVIKGQQGQAGWMAWPEALRDRRADALEAVKREHGEALEFQRWLQWQAFLQFSAASKAVRKKGVFLMGDLPFLVSLDSADVWSRKHYFKLQRSAGAPPDLYFADGQEWGMPPYDWEALERAGYDYWKARLRYASNFYQLFRIDHFVGLIRVWSFPRGGPPHEKKAGAAFDPPDEALWEASAEKRIRMLLEASDMLPCAEDLGTIPACSPVLLERLGLPGMEIQRWTRHWEGDGSFKRPEEYRLNALVTLSTHDMAPFCVWWEKEAMPEEKEKFLRSVGLSADPEIVGNRHACSLRLLQAAFKTAADARSVFCIHSLQDVLALAGDRARTGADLRINEPGRVHERNWRLRLPFIAEDLKKLPFNRPLTSLHKASGRI